MNQKRSIEVASWVVATIIVWAVMMLMIFAVVAVGRAVL